MNVAYAIIYIDDTLTQWFNGYYYEKTGTA